MKTTRTYFETAWKESEPLLETCKALAEPGAAFRTGGSAAAFLLDHAVTRFDPGSARYGGLRDGCLALAALAGRMSAYGVPGRAAAFEAVEQRLAKSLEQGAVNAGSVRRIMELCGRIHDMAVARAAKETHVSANSLADTGIPISWRKKHSLNLPLVLLLVASIAGGVWFARSALQYKAEAPVVPQVSLAPEIEKIIPPQAVEEKEEQAQELPWDDLEAFFASREGIASMLPAPYAGGFLSQAIAVADACSGDGACIDDGLRKHFRKFLEEISKNVPEKTRSFAAITKGRGRKFRDDFYALLVATAKADRDILVYLMSRAGAEDILRPAGGEENPVLQAYDSMAGVSSLFPYDETCGIYIRSFGTEALGKCIDDAPDGAGRTQCAASYAAQMRDRLMEAAEEFAMVSGTQIDPATVVRKCAHLGAYLSAIRFFIAKSAYRNTDFYRYLDVAGVFDVRARWFRALTKWRLGGKNVEKN